MKHAKLKTFVQASRLVVLLAVLFTTILATGQIWIPSTGTVDEGSLTSFQFTGGAAFLRTTVSTGFAILRFNVLPVGSLATALTQPCCEGRALMVSYIDDGPGAQVLVSLKRYNIKTGKTTTVLTFDSNNFPVQSTFKETAPTGGSFFNFSFATGPTEGVNDLGGDSEYFIEAQLIRSAPGGNPGIASIRIVNALAP